MNKYDDYIYEIEFDDSKMDEYKRGLISGIMYMIMGTDTAYMWIKDHDGKRWYKWIQCTGAQLCDIIAAIDKVFGRDFITFIR